MTSDPKRFLRLGLIQTTTDNSVAWVTSVRMARYEEEWAIAEITQHMTALMQQNPRPDIVLLPELAVPLGFLRQLRRIAMEMNAVVIGGLDFQRDPGDASFVMNRAVVIVPNGWRTRARSSSTTLRYVGKTYPSAAEEQLLTNHHLGFRRLPDVWVFQTPDLGRFAVTICYDFLDLERVAMYRSNIQHLFVLAYNRDLRSFDHAAEAMSRMIFCNVVVCNAGHYGGSLAVSPYYRPEQRTIYRHEGQRLSTSQLVELPVADLLLAQSDTWPTNRERQFKSLPPGALNAEHLDQYDDNLL